MWRKTFSQGSTNIETHAYGNRWPIDIGAGTSPDNNHTCMLLPFALYPLPQRRCGLCALPARQDGEARDIQINSTYIGKPFFCLRVLGLEAATQPRVIAPFG